MHSFLKRGQIYFFLFGVTTSPLLLLRPRNELQVGGRVVWCTGDQDEAADHHEPTSYFLQMLKPSILSLTLSEEKVKRVYEDKQYLNERCDLCGWCINQGKKNKHGALHPHIQTPPVCSSLNKHSEKLRNCRVLSLSCIRKVIIPLTVTWSVFP